MVRRGSGIYLIEVNYEHENYWSVCMYVGGFGFFKKVSIKIKCGLFKWCPTRRKSFFSFGHIQTDRFGQIYASFHVIILLLLCGWPTSIGSVTCGGRWHNRNPSVSAWLSGWMNVCPYYNNHNELIGIIESTDSHRKSTPSLWYVFCCCSSCTIPIDHTTTNILFLVVLLFFLLCPSLSLRNLI